MEVNFVDPSSSVEGKTVEEEFIQVGGMNCGIGINLFCDRSAV